ncbi:MAG: 50S ribosomal protein L35 [Nevskiaceae bacterium]|nr:MAG: 50S ribosomal protein L35 [Nevskiaceae bacterium]TBR74066.1 MAG: 50S ribosomal protein L35 [Nevskiaceae bacterium]
MPKIKSNRGAAKRFSSRSTGFKRGHAQKRHILTKKSAKRIRQLRGTTAVHDSDVREIKQLLPYG